MNRKLISLVSYLLAGFVILLTGLTAANAQVEKGTLWRDAVLTELDVDFGDSGFHARWRYYHCDCGDLLVQVEQIDPDGILTGELLMVGGQVLLSRGFEQQNEDIEPLIQAPSLMLQLAFGLLNHAQPEGPFGIDGKQVLEKNEKTIDFKLDTGLATGIFAAPWDIQGSGWKTDSGNRRFEMLFQFTNPLPEQADNTDSITFSGDLDFRQQDFPYPETTDLEGWKIQWVSLNERESKSITRSFTLKFLREQLKNQ